MSEIVIKAENLGKKYTIGHQSENDRYLTLRDVLMNNARKAWNKTKDLAKGKDIIPGDTLEDVWVLKDVSFEIPRGEAVGIIGRNGAGKSTLLKILSRITEPSAGRVTIKGRVASLLEVGTGFHPELTGRENIYLNGTILGMTRKEIKQKFDEIVAFAEVEKYLDTPVKRYSSGMYVRLAFAVAAHLEPEILIVDEVLAVGDIAFQKKCLGKMENVTKKEGRTILFVSHNMSAIRAFCHMGLLLDKGRVVQQGDINIVANEYLESINSTDGKYDINVSDELTAIVSAKIVNNNDEHVKSIYKGEKFGINFKINNPEKKELFIVVSFTDANRTPLWTITKDSFHNRPLPRNKKINIIMNFNPPYLVTDEIYCYLGLTEKNKEEYLFHKESAFKIPFIERANEISEFDNSNFIFKCKPEFKFL